MWRLEPDAEKLARPVLRGGGGREAASLPGGDARQWRVINRGDATYLGRGVLLSAEGKGGGGRTTGPMKMTNAAGCTARLEPAMVYGSGGSEVGNSWGSIRAAMGEN
jgi:hypothetical protein